MATRRQSQLKRTPRKRAVRRWRSQLAPAVGGTLPETDDMRVEGAASPLRRSVVEVDRPAEPARLTEDADTHGTAEKAYHDVSERH